MASLVPSTGVRYHKPFKASLYSTGIFYFYTLFLLCVLFIFQRRSPFSAIQFGRSLYIKSKIVL